MKNRCILIPTFVNHFDYAINLISSLLENDTSELDICVVTSNPNETQTLTMAIKVLGANQRLYLTDIQSLIKKAGEDVCQLDLAALGKFSYQTIKKLYGVYLLPYEQFLILDSESCMLKKANLNDIFNDYFKSPYVLFSVTSEREELSYSTFIDYITNQNCSRLLSISYNSRWNFEGFHWFYEKKIVNDLFKKLGGKLLDTIYNFSRYREGDEKAIFECILYYKFIEDNQSAYNYNFINMNEELISALGKDKFQKIVDQFNLKKFQLPYFIHGWECLHFRDLEKICQIYKKYEIPIARLYLHPVSEIIVYYFAHKSEIVIGCSSDNIIKYKNILSTKLVHKIKYESFCYFEWLLNREVLNIPPIPLYAKTIFYIRLIINMLPNKVKRNIASFLRKLAILFECNYRAI